MPSAGVPSGPSRFRAFSVFENRTYRYLWISSAFSFLGMNMQQVARALLAWELSHSFSATGAISLAFGLPMLLFSLLGGAIADRVDKRSLSLITQVAIGLTGLVTAVMVTTGTITLEILFVIGLVQGTFFAIGMPARSPLMAMVVRPDQLMGAMALSNASMNATRLVGPAIAGVLAGSLGLDWAFYLQAAMYIGSVGLLWLVPKGLGNEFNIESRRKNMFREIGLGVRYVAGDSRLRVLMLMGLILSFFGMPYVMLLPGFVQRDLGEGSEAVGLLMSLTGVGALIGSVAIAAIADSPRKPAFQLLTGLFGGASLIGLQLSSSAFGYAGAMGAIIVLGLMLNSYQTLNSGMVMEASRPEYYGRVMSINMLTFSSMSVMAAPMGLAADSLGAGTLFVVLGVLIICSMLAITLLNPGYIFGKRALPELPGPELELLNPLPHPIAGGRVPGA